MYNYWKVYEKKILNPSEFLLPYVAGPPVINVILCQSVKVNS